MPYIDQKLRLKLNGPINELVAALDEMREDDIEGCLNYTITSLLDTLPLRRKQKYGERRTTKWRYKYINRAIGVLQCVMLEFYRRLAAPYEEGAIAKHSDIHVYDDFESQISNQS